MSGQSIQPKALGAIHDAQFLDVRTPAEFEELHIPGSKLAPLDSLDPAVAQSAFDPEKPLYVVCRGGTRAKQAIGKLEAVGCTNAVLLEGGILAWDEAKLPVKRGRKTMALERQVRIAAGSLVAVGVGLSFLSPAWLALSAFVGLGLTFSGVTDTCTMGMLLAKLPWNRRGGAALACSIVCGPPADATA